MFRMNGILKMQEQFSGNVQDERYTPRAPGPENASLHGSNLLEQSRSICRGAIFRECSG